MRTRRTRRKAASPPAAHGQGGWQGLHADLLGSCLSALLEQADQRQGLLVCRSWAAVLATCRAWRALALQVRGGPPASLTSLGPRVGGAPAIAGRGGRQRGHLDRIGPALCCLSLHPSRPLPVPQMPIDAVCPPSNALIAWLRRVRVRRLEFVQRASERGDALCVQGFASSEQRYRASISTLLATLDFITHSAGCLRCVPPPLPPRCIPARRRSPPARSAPAPTHAVCFLPLLPRRELAGVHPREGILMLTPFKALERISMTGNARWVRHSRVCVRLVNLGAGQ